MTHRRTRPRATAFALGLALTLSSACSDAPTGAPTGPSAAPQLDMGRSEDVRAAIAAQERHTAALMRIPGVVGTAVGLLPNGKAAVRIFLASADVRGLPSALDGVPAVAEVSGQFVALSDPTSRQRPAPVGFSVGHPAITAGTIGARVVDGSGSVFVLSNNHVLANSNGASVGDATLQPGPFDGGTAADQIGTLFNFKPIDFSGGNNTIDAAIALSNAGDLGYATPADDGYGAPGSKIFGDADDDGVFDNTSALLNLNVQKYGRTTKLTKGKITGINGTLSICYEVLFIFCLKSARFVDQLIIDASGFSDGGDSGSLIVTDDANKSPVALLFAGSTTQTIGNRIDLVLGYFGVSVDDGNTAPPDPVTDVAITSVGVPASVTQGATVNVTVAVRNVGNQTVGGSFDVTLRDATDVVALGTQTVTGLAAGATTTLTFPWNTTSSTLGGHTLTASHTLADDNALNDQGSATTTVSAPGTTSEMHVGDLDAFPSGGGTTWSVTVEVTVHDVNHQALNGATVTGTWSVGGLNVDTCTTGGGGGTGTCILLAPSIKKSVKSVTFTVTTVTAPNRTYQSSANHDPDGSSNGTSIKVNRP
jgi:hypothetical protein